MADRIETDELIYSGRVLELHKIGLRMPDGRLLHRELIHYNGAAVILPVLDDGQIVLIHNYRFAAGGELWELPAGNLEKGEDPLDCARRELTEETGYTCRELQKLGAFFAAPGSSDEVLHSYLATGLTPGKQALETYEEITTEVFAPAKVKSMVASGEIRDAKTIATLGIYWARG